MEQVFVLLYGGGLLNRFLFCFNEVVIGTGFVVIWRWSLEQVFVFFMEVVIGTGFVVIWRWSLEQVFVFFMEVVIGTGFVWYMKVVT